MFFLVALLVFLPSSPDFIQASPLSLSKDAQDSSHSVVVVAPFGKYSQCSLNKSTAQISVTAKSTIDLAEQFEFQPIKSSKVQINQPVVFKILIAQLNLIY